MDRNAYGETNDRYWCETQKKKTVFELADFVLIFWRVGTVIVHISVRLGQKQICTGALAVSICDNIYIYFLFVTESRKEQIRVLS